MVKAILERTLKGKNEGEVAGLLRQMRVKREPEKAGCFRIRKGVTYLLSIYN